MLLHGGCHAKKTGAGEGVGAMLNIIPNDQSFVGKKLKLNYSSWKDSYFIPRYVGTKNMIGDFVNPEVSFEDVLGIDNDWKLYEESENTKISSKKLWEGIEKAEKEAFEPKKTKRLAPALIIELESDESKKLVYRHFVISKNLFFSEEDAREKYNKLFIKWPAVEGYWVEVEE